MENVVDVKEKIIENTKLVCPFRTAPWVIESKYGNIQTTIFPECHYASCPFYDVKGKTNNERCLKAQVEIGM